jgi:hypothetical protein
MFDIRVEAEQLQGFLEALEQFPAQLDAKLAQAMEKAEEFVHEQLAIEPDPIPFPPSNVNWDSPKQRRAYHATGGFGGGDPYTRAGKLDSTLENAPIEVSPGMIHGAVFSPEEWVMFVIGNSEGNNQSTIHQGRWPTIPETGKRIDSDVVAIFQEAVSQAVQEFKPK